MSTTEVRRVRWAGTVRAGVALLSALAACSATSATPATSTAVLSPAAVTGPASRSAVPTLAAPHTLTQTVTRTPGPPFTPPSTTVPASPVTSSGCPRTTATVPAGAARRGTVDVELRRSRPAAGAPPRCRGELRPRAARSTGDRRHGPARSPRARVRRRHGVRVGRGPHRRGVMRTSHGPTAPVGGLTVERPGPGAPRLVVSAARRLRRVMSPASADRRGRPSTSPVPPGAGRGRGPR